MNATATFIEDIGRNTLDAGRALHNLLTFAVRILLRLFARKSYNSASRTVFIHQFYFTAVQILPLFLFVAVIFGSLVNGMTFQVIKNLGLTDYLGRLLMGFVVTEIAPFVTVLLIALRSSSAINTEIAVMKVNHELSTLESFRIDLIDYLFVPRILNGMLSMVLLSSLFAMVVLAIGLLVSSLIFGTSVDAYMSTLLTSTSLADLLIVLFKCATFGFFITLIPIRRGLSASQELTSIPIAVLNGMVMVFIAIMVIEVLSSIIRFI
ncbi:MAG: ABC transporter permease [Deltaproteobacteria bacterium]|nr:ABC transporter permease [Deltaproteobacteria bacterium]